MLIRKKEKRIACTGANIFKMHVQGMCGETHKQTQIQESRENP